MKITIVLSIGYPRLAKWQSLISHNIYSSFDRIWVAGTRFMALLFWFGVFLFFSWWLLYPFSACIFAQGQADLTVRLDLTFYNRQWYFFSPLKSFTLSRMFFKLFSVFVRNNTQKNRFSTNSSLLRVPRAILLEWFFNGDCCSPSLSR